MIYVTIVEIIEYLESRVKNSANTNGAVKFRKDINTAIKALNRARKNERYS